MSSRPHISLSNVSKTYETIAPTRVFFREFRSCTTLDKSPKQALTNINLDIKLGESIGIFGPNGAGKSTLLAVMSGVIQPSFGQVLTRGAIAPLLQLTAWFDMEQTGRSNVLNFAAMNGLRGAARNNMLEDAEAFADIGQFFDAPVRTYSSGMVARLAYGAALNVQADFLIIDEIISVGDASFKNKCKASLKTKLSEGTTLIIVSQNPGSVMDIANRGIVINKGILKFDGNMFDTMDFYNALLANQRIKKTKGRIRKSLHGPPISITQRVEPDYLKLTLTIAGLPVNTDLNIETYVKHYRAGQVGIVKTPIRTNSVGEAELDQHIVNQLLNGPYVLDIVVINGNKTLHKWSNIYRMDIVTDSNAVGVVDLRMNIAKRITTNSDQNRTI